MRKESNDALADGSSDLLTSFLAFLRDVLMPYKGGGEEESVMEMEERVTGMTKLEGIQ